jgi:PIN domain nuclease of toxin-antitoxin system
METNGDEWRTKRATLPLLDTHVVPWFLANAPKLSVPARLAILDPANTRWVSPISLLEIALMNRIGKLPLPDPFGVMTAF